jgi:phage regulator Rha-like protein
MQNNTISVGTPNDLFPIILHEGVHVVDSRLIAEALGIDHGNFMETIKKYQDDITYHFGAVPFETEVLNHKKYRGSTRIKYALLNETQATFLATLSRNTPQVIAFKAKLVLSFAELKKDFSKIYTLWHELTQNLEKDDAQHDANIEAIEKAFQFVLNKCASLGANIADLETEVTNLRKEQKTTAQLLTQQAQLFDSFSKEIEAKIASLQNTQNQEKNVMNLIPTLLICT